MAKKEENEELRSVLELTSPEARKYFMEPKNYCTLDLPDYVDFKPVLGFVEAIVGDTAFGTLLKNDAVKPRDFEEVNHKLLIKKDAKYTFRPIQITNPYLYFLLVRTITDKWKWSEIKKRFKAFSRPQIEVASISVVKREEDKSHKAAGIFNWWEQMEQRGIALSLEYSYMFVTDITNCYPSIYTHSIAWAIHGKDKSKDKSFRRNHNATGIAIDEYIQEMQYGQTNGIPQGSTLFDFVAEIVLGYADMLLADRLKEEGVEDYKILRYRDDYKVFANDKNDLDKIAFALQEVLAGLNFQLNAKKTLMTEDLVQNVIKPDKIAYMAGAPLYKKFKKKIYTMASTLQQEAMYIHQFGKKYPNCGSMSKLLDTFSKRLRASRYAMTDEERQVMIAILNEIALGSTKVYGMVLHLISYLVNKMDTEDDKERVVKAVYKKFTRIPVIGEVQIWMQHITFKMTDAIEYNEPLCKIVAGEKDVKLWNLEWLKEEYKKKFPQELICTDEARAKVKPVINIDEVALFNAYKQQ